jgi:hypothetical protein
MFVVAVAVCEPSLKVTVLPAIPDLAGGAPAIGRTDAGTRSGPERAARSAQINTFGGGVLEVLREIVATTGLQMARAGR